MTGSRVRRITMETGQGFGVSWANVLAWSGSALHLGHCDYSDSDEETGGFDIDEPLDLLAWLIADRFGQDNDALGEYAARVGIDGDGEAADFGFERHGFYKRHTAGAAVWRVWISARARRNDRVDSAPWLRFARLSWRPSRQPPVSWS